MAIPPLALARDAAESAADASYHSKPNHGGSAYDLLTRKVDQLAADSATAAEVSKETASAIQTSLEDRKAMLERADEQSEILRAVVDHLGLNQSKGEDK